MHETAMVTEELSTATERVDASFQTGGETEPLQAKEPERERERTSLEN